MAVLGAVRLKNFRCFSDTGLVSIRPITLLVGKNSSGKSTFARLLPLLRQSAEEEKRSPILWYGRLIDFGNFGTVLNRNSETRDIEISLKISLPRTRSPGLHYAYHYYDQDEILLSEDTEIQATIRVEQKDKTKPCYASCIRLELFNNVCELRFSDTQKLQEIQFNDFVWSNNDSSIIAQVSQQRIFPGIKFLRQVSRRMEQGEQKIFIRSDPFRSGINEVLYETVANRNTDTEKLNRIVSGIPVGTDEAILKALRTSPFATKSFREKASRLSANNPKLHQFRNLIYLRNLPLLLSELDKNLNEIVSGVRYIEPLRATAQRYYRIQELSVDELDSKGTNVAMFIDSLTDTERARLNNWLDEHFSVRLRANNEGGHIALELIQSDSQSGTNLADLGFGFSQLLPIVLQLWQASQPHLFRSRRSRPNKSSIVVIEQPELHLHPAYQARVADVVVAAIDNSKGNGRDISVIAETHSPHLINRFGQLIESGKLKPDDIQVILFEDSSTGSKSNVIPTYFDREGVLVNWPYGFFEPEN